MPSILLALGLRSEPASPSPIRGRRVGAPLGAPIHIASMGLASVVLSNIGCRTSEELMRSPEPSRQRCHGFTKAENDTLVKMGIVLPGVCKDDPVVLSDELAAQA